MNEDNQLNMWIENVYFKIQESKKPKAIVQSETGKTIIREMIESQKETSVKISEETGWYDFQNRYEIFETEKYFIQIVWQEYTGLGTEWADDTVSNEKNGYHINIERKDWIEEKIKLQHWEDGTMYFDILPIAENRIKYRIVKFFEDIRKKKEREEYFKSDNIGISDDEMPAIDFNEPDTEEIDIPSETKEKPKYHPQGDWQFWKEQEYRDFGCDFDGEEYDIMFYKEGGWK
jgi:hypothetical protein